MIYHRKFISSFGYAYRGILLSVKYNQNLRIHFFVAFLVILAGIFLQVSIFEMEILSVVILFVICCEMINTAIEEMTDLITKEHRQEAKIAKDVAAGMVLLASIGAVIVGLLVFLPHIFSFA